jgi:hypothetical protein
VSLVVTPRWPQLATASAAAVAAIAAGALTARLRIELT